MNIQDYKNASKKLNDFCHEAKMFYDINYRTSFELQKRMNQYIANAFKGMEEAHIDWILNPLTHFTGIYN